jgi:predicted DNA-binding transcriptional regulator AlpA
MLEANHQQPVASDLVDEHAAASILQISVSTLQKDRWRGHRIPYVKLGRTVRYRRSDLEAVIEASVRHGEPRAA